MNRLFVFSDLHGSLTAWLTVLALMSQEDGLAVAGDLFDTRYGRYGDPDFQPEQIRADLRAFDRPFFYVYGNCDVPGFFPGYDSSRDFSAFGKRIFLHHGHRPVPEDCQADIIIQGHTHLCELETREGILHMNPGSIALPRNSPPSFGIIDPGGTRIVRLQTLTPLATVSF